MNCVLALVSIPLLAVLVPAGHAVDPISPPAHVRITGSSPAHVRVEWDDPLGSATGHRIWRRQAGGHEQSWRLVGEVLGRRTHFDDGGLDPGTRYEHHVTALHRQAESGPSTVAVSTTPAMSHHLDSSIVVPWGETYAHSPSAVVDEEGRIILAYVLGNTAHRDRWRGSSIWLRVSHDGGQSWSPPHPALTGGDTRAFAKPSLVLLPDGRLGMSYSQFTLDTAGRLPASGNRSRFFHTSASHGWNWSEPVKVGDGSSNNDALVRGDGDRLLEALQTGYARSSEPLCLITASDDFGKSWRLLSRAGARPEAQPTGESDLVHLGGGRLVMLSRHEAPFYCLNFSSDNGSTWDGPHTLWLGGGDNPPKIVRIPATQTLVAVVHSYTDGTQKKDRRQIASVISTDGGRTWDNFRLIGFAPDAADGFLQHALVFRQDEALLFYSDGSKGDTNQSRNLRLIRLHRDFFTSRTPWPYDGQGLPLQEQQGTGAVDE
jgi:hypothetical protein